MERKLRQFQTARSLQSWAHLFGFDIEMGRQEETPYIEVDGVRFEGDDVDGLMAQAAMKMGMDLKENK